MRVNIGSIVRCGAGVACILMVCARLSFAQAASQNPPANTTPSIEVLSDKKKFNALATGHLLLVAVKQSGVARLSAHTIDIAAGLLPVSAVRFEAPQGDFAQGSIVSIPFSIDAQKLSDLPAGSHDVIVRVDALDKEGKTVFTTLATLTLTRSEHQLTPQVTPLTLRLQREYPFETISATHCVQLRAVPADRFPIPSVEAGELYAGPGTPPAVVPDVIVRGRFAQCPEPAGQVGSQQGAGNNLPPLVITSTLPGGVTRGTSTLAIVGPDVKPGTNVSLQLVAKDFMLWPFFVVVLATILSALVHRWIASGRSSSINLADMGQITDELHNLRALRPGIDLDPEFTEVWRLLATAGRQQDLGDVQAASTTIASARQKLDALIVKKNAGGPQGAAQALGMQQARTITVETQGEEELSTSRVLTFKINGPMPAAGAVVAWQIGRNDNWSALDVAPDPAAIPPESRVTTRRPIAEPGVYAVRLMVDGQDELPTTFRISPSRATTLLRRVRKTDYSIDVLAAVISGLITLSAILELDSFGTLRDYIVQFVGAFGIAESVKGFSQVLGAVRKV